MFILDRDAKCEHCGSNNLVVQTCDIEHPFYPESYYRIKCCNCNAILSNELEYKEKTTISTPSASELLEAVNRLGEIPKPPKKLKIKSKYYPYLVAYFTDEVFLNKGDIPTEDYITFMGIPVEVDDDIKSLYCELEY